MALGASWVLSGQLDAGIETLRYGMKISPRDRRLGFWGWALGTFLLRADRLDEALSEARASSRRDPQFPLPRVLEAAILDRQGQTEEARAALARARQTSSILSQNIIALTHGRHVGKRLALLWDRAD